MAQKLIQNTTQKVVYQLAGKQEVEQAWWFLMTNSDMLLMAVECYREALL